MHWARTLAYPQWIEEINQYCGGVKIILIGENAERVHPADLISPEV